MTDMTLDPSAAPGSDPYVDALNGAFGHHHGARASHARGLSATGRFTADAAAAELEAELFRGTHPLHARFSIAGGNPLVSEKAPAARGLAISVETGGGLLDLVMISTPMFFAATGDSFVAFLDARRPDPQTGKPDPARIEESNRTHMDSEAQRAWLAATPPSESFATSPYFPVHTYRFARRDGSSFLARWEFEPEAGRIGLSSLADAPDIFLEQELRQRLARGPARWRVSLVLPAASDPVRNVTVAWPDDRTRLPVGTLEIDAVTDRGDAQDSDARVFDPEHLPTGITPAGDPIFSLRSPAYAVSKSYRSA